MSCYIIQLFPRVISHILRPPLFGNFYDRPHFLMRLFRFSSFLKSSILSEFSIFLMPFQNKRCCSLIQYGGPDVTESSTYIIISLDSLTINAFKVGYHEVFLKVPRQRCPARLRPSTEPASLPFLTRFHRPSTRIIMFAFNFSSIPKNINMGAVLP